MIKARLLEISQILDFLCRNEVGDSPEEKFSTVAGWLYKLYLII